MLLKRWVGRSRWMGGWLLLVFAGCGESGDRVHHTDLVSQDAHVFTAQRCADNGFRFAAGLVEESVPITTEPSFKAPNAPDAGFFRLRTDHSLPFHFLVKDSRENGTALEDVGGCNQQMSDGGTG